MKLEPIKFLFSALVSMNFLTACVWSDPVQVEEDFGNSVRHMIEQQKRVAESVKTPTNNSSMGLDGDSVINSLDLYRAAQKRKTKKESLNSFELSE